jgi:hypothetical protein
MGWPLQLASLALMVWLLARNATPISDTLPASDSASDADSDVESESA